MDLFVDPDGVVIVRNCGCGKHGLNSLWTEHEDDWRAAHAKNAQTLLAEHRARPHLTDKKDRFDQADAVVRRGRQ